MPKKVQSGNTPPRQFRLSEEVMDDLQKIADEYARQSGMAHSRADVIRLLVRRESDRIAKKNRGK